MTSPERAAAPAVTATGGDPVAVAQRIADEVFLPDAVAIDRSALVPVRYLDTLAAAGLYGLFGPAGAGGLDAGPLAAGRVVEALGGGSLAATFVWIQHHTAVRTVAAAGPAVRERWLGPLCAGRLRAGIAVAALRRPGPPAMVAAPDGDGWRLDGVAPWVTGWGRIDVLAVAARHAGDVVWALVDATPAPTLATEAQDLAAMASTGTVTLRLRGHRVPADRIVAVEPVEEWRARDARGLRLNGSLPLGVAARAAQLLGSGALAAEVDRARQALEAAPAGELVGPRTEASLLALRATAALVASGGGRSMDQGGDAARLAREALFLVVFGQTGAIRDAQVAALTEGR